MLRFCALFGHHRSMELARLNHATQDWESSCKYCGAAMVRIKHGDWRLKAKPSDELNAESG